MGVRLDLMCDALAGTVWPAFLRGGDDRPLRQLPQRARQPDHAAPPLACLGTMPWTERAQPSPPRRW